VTDQMVGRRPPTDRASAGRYFAVEFDEPAPRTLLVRVRGEFGGDAVDAFDSDLHQRLTAPRPCRVVLDLSRVSVLAPAALNALLRLRRRCRIENVHLVLVGVSQPAVNRPLRMAGALPLFDIRPTVEAASRGPVLRTVDATS